MRQWLTRAFVKGVKIWYDVGEVMRMIRSGEQICNYKLVNFKSGTDNLFNARIKFFAKPFCVKVPENDSAEDRCDGGISEKVDIENIEMSTESFR